MRKSACVRACVYVVHVVVVDRVHQSARAGHGVGEPSRAGGTKTCAHLRPGIPPQKLLGGSSTAYYLKHEFPHFALLAHSLAGGAVYRLFDVYTQ